MGDNYREVDLTANGLLNVGDDDLGVPNMNTYSINSNSSTNTLYTIQSDEIGNITNVNGLEINWNGRRLESISQGGTVVVSYDYNIDGQRTKKIALDTETGEYITTEFFYNGEILAGQKKGDDVIVFMYDNNGDLFGFTYNGTPYYYVKNAQNDVFMILNENGQPAVLYQYDAWGVITACYDGTEENIASINPITYRSYYMDFDLGFFMYYLNSRYYMADWGRFVSADSYVQTGQGMLDKNMFAYCLNNPVNRIDANGENSDALKLWATTMSWLCFVDSLLPIGDMVYWGGLLLLTAGCAAGVAIAQPSISTPKVEEKEVEKDVVIDIPKKQDKGTKIYRYGGTNPSNLTPKEKDKKTGLSFSTIPQPGAAVTTIEELNATGIVFAVQDGPYHVSVIPVNGTVQDWIDAGTDSIWTHAVKSSVIKWDGVN